MIENNRNFNLKGILQLVEFCNANNITLNSSKRGYNANIIERFKKGNKIKIKEKNKGSFTRWCGGNVTSECIRRGKASSNPKIRKKATFAANSRKWNHK